MKTLHTIGDSHALYGWPMIEVGYQIQCHHLGARLMASVNQRKLDGPIGHALEQVRPGDVVCFCFGEIDCRVYADQYGVEGMAQEYLGTLRELLDWVPPGPRLVMGVVPPQREPRPKHNGTAMDRKFYVISLNKDLERLATAAGWGFVNVYDRYRNEAGYIATLLAGPRGHVGEPEPLEDAVKVALEFGLCGGHVRVTEPIPVPDSGAQVTMWEAWCPVCEGKTTHTGRGCVLCDGGPRCQCGCTMSRTVQNPDNTRFKHLCTGYSGVC